MPIIAAGGVATAADVTETLEAGAEAARWAPCCYARREWGVGHPSGGDRRSSRTETVDDPGLHRSTGARLRNRFIDTYEARAPFGYPAIHHLTSPLRKAAAAAGEPDLVHLWAGTGFRHATAEPTAVDPDTPRRTG